MIEKQSEQDTLTLGGDEFSISRRLLPQADLKFYPENPRIYSIVYAEESEPSQTDIEEKLIEMDHVKQLAQSIKANGGLIDPLIVCNKDYLVFEGNSRLAAYRLLALSDPIKWGKVKCCLLPSDIGKDAIFSLLGKYHIIGRKDWAPYEQAGYLWRRCTHHNISPENIAKEMGLSTQKVKASIRVYSFMKEHNDLEPQRWSYYDEYLKSQKINKRREEFPELDDVIVKKINSGEIAKAVDIRDKVAKIAGVRGKTGTKLMKKLLKTPNSIEKVFAEVIEGGAGNIIYKILTQFRARIGDHEIKSDLKNMSEGHLNKCRYELKKIKQRVEALLDLTEY